MIYLENTTQSQQVYIPRQVIQTATTREINIITSGDVINIVDSKLEDYYTSSETDVQIENACGIESARCEETYAKIEDIPDVSDFVTSADVKTQIEDYHYITSGDLPDVSDFITSGQAQEQINQSLDGYATEQWVEDKHYLTEHQSLSAYSTTEQIEGMLANESARTEETYAKKSDVPDLDNYYTSAETNTEIENAVAAESARCEETYAKPADIPDVSDFITSADAKTQIDEAIAIESARCESTYLKEHQSLAGLFNSVDYVSSAKTIVFYDKENTQVGVVDATDFIKDGMVDNVYISGETLYIVFNTDAGKETIELDLTQIFDANNYYTKQDIDNKHFVNSGEVKTQIEGYNYVTSGEVETQITSKNYILSATTESVYENDIGKNKIKFTRPSEEDINIYFGRINGMSIVNKNFAGAVNFILPTSADVKTQVDEAIGAESARCEETYAKISDIPDVTNFVTSAQVETQITDKNYVNSGDVQTQIDNNLSAYTKTSGFATINGSGITDGGNLVIEGGGGGGNANIIELTQQQYEDLTAYTEDALYVISDAEEVDLNNYATSGDIQTLSGQVQTLSGAVGNKADKISTTARNSGYNFPYWNAQGIITGYTQAYKASFNINGGSRTIYSTSSSAMPTVYAPTTAGSQGQPLISNGSGAPVWASFKFWYGTQTEYDAITTKDSSTIYFVKPD